jgi:hypothetical protein
MKFYLKNAKQNNGKNPKQSKQKQGLKECSSVAQYLHSMYSGFDPKHLEKTATNPHQKQTKPLPEQKGDLGLGKILLAPFSVNDLGKSFFSGINSHSSLL